MEVDKVGDPCAIDGSLYRVYLAGNQNSFVAGMGYYVGTHIAYDSHMHCVVPLCIEGGLEV